MTKKIFTLFGLGRLPFSASISSLLALILFFLIYSLISFRAAIIIFIFILILTFIFINSNKKYLLKDPKEVVIDEFLGMYLLLIIASPVSFPVAVVLLALFRAIDLAKVWPFHYADEWSSKYAFILDDLIIGLVIGLAAILFKAILF